MARMTQWQKRTFAVESIRALCIAHHQEPRDLDSAAAVGMLDDLCHIDPDCIAVKWYMTASDKQIDLFEQDWNNYA